MSELIGKLRRSWRSYLLWGMFWALLVVPLTLSMIFASLSEGEANKKYAPELRKIAEQTPLYPRFQKTSEYVVLKRSMVYFFTTYNSDAQFVDVEKFYDLVLVDQGWGPPQQTPPSIFVGEAHSVTYRRGDYEIFLAQNEGSSSYSIVFLWKPE
jgi:hypothetical protein